MSREKSAIFICGILLNAFSLFMISSPSYAFGMVNLKAQAQTPIIQHQEFITPTQYGSFTFSRLLYKGGYAPLAPYVPVLSWMRLSDVETRDLAHVQDEYAKVICFYTNTCPKFESKIADVSKDFLNRYADGDGAIVVLMMLGHIRNMIESNRSPSLWMADYEQAIRHILQKHPERIPFILDDLVDMGISITQVKDTTLLDSNTEVLFFSFQFLVEFEGLGRSQVFSLVREKGNYWKLLPLPIHPDTDADYSNVQVVEIGDINSDGETEVIVSTDAYRTGMQLYVYVFQGGSWRNIFSDNYDDGRNGSFWIEDLNHSGLYEIVIYFADGVGTGAPSSVEIFQSDKESGTYTSTLSIKTQVCGYHAFAEAERLRKAGQLANAIPWYETARERWTQELKTPNPTCVRDELGNIEFEILPSFARQLAVQDEITGTRSLLTDIYGLADFIGVKESKKIDDKDSKSQTTIEQEMLYICDTPACRVIARYFMTATTTQVFSTGQLLVCKTSRKVDDDGYAQVTDKKLLIQVSEWSCEFSEDASSSTTTTIELVQVVNVCGWDGHRFKTTGNRVIDRY